jgi:hypothetical protein
MSAPSAGADGSYLDMTGSSEGSMAAGVKCAEVTSRGAVAIPQSQ